MAGPKKKIGKQKTYKETTGKHVLSPDGKECYIGGSRFKRTVLPSVATPSREDQKLLSDLDDIDKPAFTENVNS
jgi:hypothetical protein